MAVGESEVKGESERIFLRRQHWLAYLCVYTTHVRTVLSGTLSRSLLWFGLNVVGVKREGGGRERDTILTKFHSIRILARKNQNSKAFKKTSK